MHLMFTSWESARERKIETPRGRGVSGLNPWPKVGMDGRLGEWWGSIPFSWLVGSRGNWLKKASPRATRHHWISLGSGSVRAWRYAQTHSNARALTRCRALEPSLRQGIVTKRSLWCPKEADDCAVGYRRAKKKGSSNYGSKARAARAD